MKLKTLANSAISTSEVAVSIVDFQGKLGIVGKNEDVRTVLTEMILIASESITVSGDTTDPTVHEFMRIVQTVMRFKEYTSHTENSVIAFFPSGN